MRMMLLFILSITLLTADHDDIKKGEMFHIPYDMSYLHLSTPQHRQIHALLSSHRQKLRQLHQEKEKLEKELKHTFSSKNFDKALFIRRSMKLKQHAVKIEAAFLEALHAILLPSQRKAFAHYLEEWDDD